MGTGVRKDLLAGKQQGIPNIEFFLPCHDFDCFFQNVNVHIKIA